MVNISINPPPTDKCCECCGKNIKELKPFGKEGDPLVGNFEGALLLKTFRTMALETKEVNDFDKTYTTEPEMIKKYGIEKYNELLFRSQLEGTVEASWECRNCIILSEEDYFKIKFK